MITLTVNGRSTQLPILKSGLKPGDALLISRPLGTGVLFAGAMAGATKVVDLDAALLEMASSQHMLIKQIEPIRQGIHACTDITGFGLLASRRDAPKQPRTNGPARWTTINLQEHSNC